MRASTERTLTTFFTLGILGVGAWWVWRNVLPAIASGLKTKPPPPTAIPTGIPTTPAALMPSPDFSFISDTAKAMAEAMSVAFRNGFSGPATLALIEEAKEGVSPSPEKDAYSYVQPWRGLTGYPQTVYDPVNWEKYYESRQTINLRNI